MNYLKKDLEKYFGYKEILGFIFAIIVTFILDITFTPILPFWLPLALTGITIGFFIGSERAAIYTGIGAMIGRLLSLLIFLIVHSHLSRILNILYKIANELSDLPALTGTLVVMLLSVSIAGIITSLGGIIGGSISQLISLFQQIKSEK